MRDLIDLIKLLEGDGATEGTDGVKAKGLYPDELKKRDNFNIFIGKINKGLPFIYHPTGEEVYIKRSEANKIKQLFDTGQLIGKKITIMTNDGNQINLGELRKTEEFGGSSKENLKLKPSTIGKLPHRSTQQWPEWLVQFKNLTMVVYFRKEDDILVNCRLDPSSGTIVTNKTLFNKCGVNPNIFFNNNLKFLCGKKIFN
jgi:hypothetical protein